MIRVTMDEKSLPILTNDKKEIGTLKCTLNGSHVTLGINR